MNVDFKKELKDLYNPPARQVMIMDVPPMNFLMVDGSGNPNTAPEYREVLEVLYNLSYTLKFMLKKEAGVQYTVAPLEGLWWVDDLAEFSLDKKDRWKWTMMIMQPPYVTADLVGQALFQARQKKNSRFLSQVHFETFHEGLSAQIMHIGPYAAEGPTIEKLHRFITDNGYTFRGKHHEIYLGDPRRSAPDKLKTVVRQPIERLVHPEMTASGITRV